MKKYYTLGGLPRSGSTLLCALISQHPDAHASQSTPVLGTMRRTYESMLNDEYYKAKPNEAALNRIVDSIKDSFYYDVNAKVIVDKNRAWTQAIFMRDNYGFENKHIVCVRNIDEILASFITLANKNKFMGEGKMNFIDADCVKQNLEVNDFNRCQVICAPEGVVGSTLDSIKMILDSDDYKPEDYLFVEYEELVNETQDVMNKVFNFLGLETVKCDLTNIRNKNEELDKEVYGMEGMHDVRSTISKTSANPKDILPQEWYEVSQGEEVWRIVFRENKYKHGKK